MKPIQYDYIERKNSSTGFLAQEVFETYPTAVSGHIGIIPNIFEEAIIEGNTITFKNTNNIELNVSNIIKICKDSDYLNGENYNITNVIDKNTFVIDKNNFSSSNIYLYGMLVNDFLSIDYNQITTLNTKGIQDLYKIIQKQQEIIENQKSQINNILDILRRNNIT